MNGLGLKTRIILYSIIPAFIISCAMTMFFSFQKFANINESLIERSQRIIYPLSTTTSFAITQNNLPLLQGLINETHQNNSKNILGIAVFDQYNKMLATTTTIPENSLFQLKPHENEFILSRDSVQYVPDGIIMRMPIYAYDNKSLLTLYDANAYIPTKINSEKNEDIVFANPKIKYPRQIVGYICLYYLKIDLEDKLYKEIFLAFIISLVGISIAFFFGITLVRMIIDPINKITSVIHEIRDGNINVKVIGVMHGELERLRTYINSMVYTMNEFHNEMQFNVDTATNDLRYNNDKLKEIENLLEIAKHDAQESSRIKNEFLANMSHELRTPLNGIIGFSHQLHKTGLSQNQTDFLNTIERSANNLLSIVNNILDFTKLESHKLILESIPFSLRHLCYDTVELLIPTAHAKGLELTITFSHDLPDSYIGDPLRIGQILTNLIGNAIKFTKQGNVSLEISLSKTTKSQNKHIELFFIIKDTGIGINSKQQEQLFTAFTQADSSISRKYGGTGLGLVITKHLIEQMNGNIELDSSENHGSTFSFYITLEHTIAPIQEPNPFIHIVRNKRIAIIETNTWVRSSIVNILSEWEMQCFPMSLIDPLNTINENNHIDYVIIGLPKKYDINNLTIELLPIINSEIKRIIIALNSYDIDKDILELSEKICIISKPIFPEKLLIALSDDSFTNKQHSEILKQNNILEPKTSQSFEKFNKNSLANNSHKNNLIKASILAVDDNEANLTLIKTLLTDKVSDVHIANNGHEAIEKCLHTEFDLIFMDIQMPNIDGIETMKIIRKNSTNANTPVIAITALVIQEEKERFITQGIDAVLEKPISETELNNCLITYCAKSSINNAPLLNTSSAPVTEIKENSLWDINRALNQCAHKKSLAIEMLEMFINSIAEIQESIINREQYSPKEIASIVHKFAGGAVYCGIKGIKEICNLIERELKNNSSIEDLEPEFLELQDLIERVLDNKDLWLNALKKLP